MSNPGSHQDIHRIPLIYPDIVSEQFTNILLIDKSVVDYQQIYDATNLYTFPIVYIYGSSKKDLLEVLRTNFTTIARIGLVFNSSGEYTKKFLDVKPFFSEDEPISENTQFLIDIIKEFQVQNIDFLACDTLNYTNWSNFYNTLMNETGVIVGASSDKTGNIKYGGDWVLESTSQDVECIYFTEIIEYYTYLLDGEEGIDGIRYNLYNSGNYAVVVGLVVDSAVDIVIPSTVVASNSQTYTVTTIGDYGLASTSITGATLPNTITVISFAAFWRCPNITHVNIPSTVTSIGGYAFYQAVHLTNVDISSNNLITSIEDYTFTECYSISSFTIPPNVTTIGEWAFSNCRILGIVIPASVISIGNSAFTTNTFSNGVIFEPGGALTTIGESAFQACNFTSITIPNTVTSLGKYAFLNCWYATSITIPSSVTVYDQGLFNNCYALNNVVVASTVTSLGVYCFFNCTGLSNISFAPDSVLNTINSQSFYACPFTSIILPSSLVNISAFAFQYCPNLTSITIPSSVTNIYDYTFFQCSSLVNIGFLHETSLPTFTGDNIFLDIAPNPVIYMRSAIYNESNVTIFNDLGFSNVTIIQAPSEPRDVSGTTPSFGTVRLTWVPPYLNGGADITSYIVNYSSPADGTSGNVVLGSATEYTLSNLTWGYIYEFSVQAINMAGIGPASSPYLPIQVTCFKEGSKILTIGGYKPIESLKKGDLVKTLRNGFVPIDMIGKRTFVHSSTQERIKEQLYRCSPSKYPGLLDDLVLSGCHCVLVDKFASNTQREDVFKLQGDIFITDNKYRLPVCLDERADVYELNGSYTLYHLALENKDYYMNYGIFANGLLVESCSKRSLRELSRMELIE